MSVSPFAAANPPLKPPSLFGDDSISDSEKLMDLCADTLEEVDFTVLATKSLISAIVEALDASLFGASQVFELDLEGSQVCELDSEGQVCELDSMFDDAIVPETAFEAMDVDMIEGFVPDSEEEEGGAEAGGGESGFSMTEATPVTADEVARKRSRSSSPDMDEMIGLILPAYLKLVSSFPHIFI
ncbi:hypothetical protein OROHE_007793 [Orobanche hederae]